MIYENLTKNNDTIKHSFNINFVQGAYLEIKSGGTDEFYCEFIDKSTNKVVYSTTLKSHHWSRVNKKYFIDWNVKVYQHNKLIYDYHFNCEGKRVFIVLDSKSLGDTLAWFPMVDEFRKKHNCHVVVSTFHNDWFIEQYPELEFVEPGSTCENLYAMYNLGWFYFEGGDEADLSKNVSDFKKIPLQQSASDILGLPPIEVRPKLKTYRNIANNFKVHDIDWLNSVSNEIFDQKEYNYKEISVQPDDVVVDLGGNIGLFAAYALSKGASKVYTVEPFPTYVNYLHENLEQFKDKVEIIPMAISDTVGHTTLNINFQNNTILNDVYKELNWKNNDESVTVEKIDLITLSERNNIDIINYLKVDIEGSEYLLFKGLTGKFLSKKVEKIAIEYHWNYNGEIDSIIEKLKDNNFEVYEFETNSNNKIGKIYAYNRSLYVNKKQVSIAIHSTAQSKYWNNPKGWNLVVDFLKRRGYKVKLLSREGDDYMGNKHPKGIEQLTPGPISKVIEELQKSEVFIGIGSGLSWLSWATNTPTILISGFSEGYSETQDKVYRITAPEGVCSGCYNRYKLDAGDWNWCPDQKNTIRQFECSKSIQATTVINELKKILGYE
jgi:FkbM family methyltransferase